jgi:membrane protein required for colicin V production
MNTIDVAIVVVLLGSGALGIYWGMIRQVLSIGGVMAAVAAAGRYGPPAADSILSFMSDGALAQMLGFLLVFLAVSGAVSLLSSLLHELAGLLFLGWADHAIGGLLGLLQGLLVCTALLIAASAFPHSMWSPALGRSQLAAPLASLCGSLVLGLLPESYRFAAETMLRMP